MASNSRCAACKYLRKRCPSDCIFSPYFPSNDPKRFENVHKIYGASNIARMLQRIPVHLREDAANCLHYEAHCRVQDPVYGCVKLIYQLQQELNVAQNQLVKAQAEIALLLNVYGPPEDYISGPQTSEEDLSYSFENCYTQPNIHGHLPLDPSSMGSGLM
ncbi:LOB domain-containing protein 24-like [Chenopodium quinoa]|uniref:LOB domain-containing protein 24-like n=1 Tax=Chenopodium quinoa TaxID=63459 RepID=UPI000B78A497|nr:LOB domain-containing protein 24-like [Chenopodium quinoa]